MPPWEVDGLPFGRKAVLVGFTLAELEEDAKLLNKFRGAGGIPTAKSVMKRR